MLSELEGESVVGGLEMRGRVPVRLRPLGGARHQESLPESQQQPVLTALLQWGRFPECKSNSSALVAR